MGTVLSFSPRERRPIYTTTHHHHHHQHHGSGTISSSNSTSDFQLSTSYAYEQINNAKNRENITNKPMQYLTVPNQFNHHNHHNGNGVLFTSSTANTTSSSTTTTTTTNILNNNLSCSNTSIDERQVDSARILSEKNAIEKNLKKHSLFINALSWKRLSSSHGKKKQLEANNNVKNKSVTTSTTFRPPTLTDVVHPMVVVNEKKKFQQHQLVTTSKNSSNTTQSTAVGGGQTLFYDPGDPKSLIALDLQRAAKNANNLHHHHLIVDKVAPKNSHPLRPIQLIENQGHQQQSSAPRKTIIQDYEIFQALGKGGFATVYRAKCLGKNQDVAIKMIDKKLMQAYQMTDRVRQEVAIHSRLKHPSILELYTFFEDNNFVYLVLELAHNGALHKYITERQRTLNELEAANILGQAVSGLQYLHSNNIMHRDISLSNLLLTSSMQVKIADFGLATQLDQHYENKHTTLCGTPNYISPEVASRSAHGLPTDVWGLGCLLYTLLVGRPPFDMNGVKSTLTQVVIGNYTIPDHVSAQARDLIQKLLCKDPTKRIKLNDVAAHPFMLHKIQQLMTIDSGIMTTSSTRSRSVEERNNIVIGSASMYRCFSSLSISQHQQPQKPSLYSQNPILQMSPAHSTHTHAKRIDIPPLNTIRLQPTRHKTKNAILSILDEPPGEVVLEFIKYKTKYGEERVHDVCRISNDGLRIVLYQPMSGKGVRIMDHPPALPQNGADHIHSYDNLPEKHWKKYMYAHRFVQMVRAKTPKITFYSELAKCQLMETLNDFEMCLYKGGKVMRNGAIMDFKTELPLNVMTQEKSIIQHAELCMQHCIRIEQTLSSMEMNLPTFPVIIGRRPVEQDALKEVRNDSNTFNNYISSSQTPVRPPKINMPSFSVDQTPSLSLAKVPMTHHRVHDTPPMTPMMNYQRRLNIPGVEGAFHSPNGTVDIQYHDGSQISVLTQEQGGGICFTASRGKHSQPIYYNENDLMPEIVRMKFKQLPGVLKHLMDHENEFIPSSTPNHQYSTPLLSNRLSNMRLIR